MLLLVASANVFGQDWLFVNQPKSTFIGRCIIDTCASNGMLRFMEFRKDHKVYFVNKQKSRAVAVFYEPNGKNIIVTQCIIFKKTDKEALEIMSLHLMGFKELEDGSMVKNKIKVIVIGNDASDLLMFKFETIDNSNRREKQNNSKQIFITQIKKRKSQVNIY